MPRDERAHLSDILESCEAITGAVEGMDLAAYQRTRLVRSSVEREFIIIGEAVAALARVAPEPFAAITRSSTLTEYARLRQPQRRAVANKRGMIDSGAHPR